MKGEFKKFKALAFRSVEEKRVYILGEDLDMFLKTCKVEIPESGTYKIAGDLDEHNRYRMVYYLYPRLRSDRPDYILNISTKDSRYQLKRVN